MEIKQVKISDLKPYDKNNKNHPKEQLDLLEQTIEKYWFTNPILINKENTIIAGHARLEAIQSLWWQEAPCLYVEWLTEAEERKLRLLDNKIAELAKDNIENIKFELDELQDMELDKLYNLDDFYEDINLDDFIQENWNIAEKYKLEIVYEDEDKQIEEYENLKKLWYNVIKK